MKYRSRTEIASEILNVASDGTTKTKIMYKAFLSYAQLKEYLAVLLENDLLRLDADQRYKTTEKGHKFLQIYNRMGEFILSDLQTDASTPRVK